MSLNFVAAILDFWWPPLIDNRSFPPCTLYMVTIICTNFGAFITKSTIDMFFFAPIDWTKKDMATLKWFHQISISRSAACLHYSIPLFFTSFHDFVTSDRRFSNKLMGDSIGRIRHVLSACDSATSLPAHRHRYGLVQVPTPGVSQALKTAVTGVGGCSNILIHLEGGGVLGSCMKSVL